MPRAALLFSWCLLCLGVVWARAESPTINPCDFGAVGDGRTLNTVAFNQAVQAAATKGHGVVLVPPGRYLTGTIYLQSGVELRLAAGAVIVGSARLEDYPENPAPTPTDTAAFQRLLPVYPARLEFGRYAIIVAAGQSDFALTGEGTIEGQGGSPEFSKPELRARGYTPEEAHARRPFGLSFVRCRNVRVEGITLRDLASWTQSFLDCDRVVIDRVRVDSPFDERNNDGIDIDGCRDVQVRNVQIDAGDDGICLKSSFRECEDVVVTDSVVRSRVNALKLGTASNAGFRRIRFSRIKVTRAPCAGVALQVVDGGLLEDVEVSDVTMDQVGAPIFIRLGDRGRKWMRPESHVVGQLRNVTIRRVTARVFTPYDARPLGASISGLPGHLIENVRLQDVTIEVLRDYSLEDVKALRDAEIPEAATDYPEYSMFGSLPAYGLYARNAGGLARKNFKWPFAERNFRPALVCDDVSDLTIDNWRARSLYAPDGAAIVLRGVHGAQLRRMSLAGEADAFVRVERASTGVVIADSDFRGARQKIARTTEVPAAAVEVR